MLSEPRRVRGCLARRIARRVTGAGLPRLSTATAQAISEWLEDVKLHSEVQELVMTRYYALQMVSLYLLMATGSLLQVSHAHTHTHTHTHTHARTRTHAHAHAHTYIHTRTAHTQRNGIDVDKFDYFARDCKVQSSY